MDQEKKDGEYTSDSSQETADVTIDKIVAQCLQEIQSARTFKQNKIGNWKLNELMYYGKAVKAVESRSSVQLSRMQEFVHTLLSKIDNPLIFKFTKRKNAQTKRVQRLNALCEIDRKIDHWDIKDIVGKKQGIIYGRSIYSYYADSIKGNYKPHLTNVDVYDFLVDPACGGIDLEDARYLGDCGLVIDKKGLLDGVKNGLFRKVVVDRLIEGPGNANDSSQEQTNKQDRTQDQNTTSRKEDSVSLDKFRFWRWYTTYEGNRMYVVLTNAGDCIRCKRIEDVLPVSEDFPQSAWPYWTWAAFPDLTEFWTPSYCDYVREIFMAQDVAINQMLDNAEAINKPQKIVNTGAIENLAELKYRRDGLIKFKGEIKPQDVVQFVQTPALTAPLEVFNILESIQEKTSGVSAQQKGVEDTDGKVGIYEGNEAAAADRFGLLNKSYSFGYERFARLWEMGVQDNLIKRKAIELIGPNGVEIVEVKRSDLFKKGDAYGVMVEASNAQLLASQALRQAKNNFLVTMLAQQAPLINKKKAIEKQAEIAGFSSDEITELLDVSVYGDSDLMGEADRDMESLLNGEQIRPNFAANNAYKQRIVNYMIDHREDMDTATFARFTAYVDSIEDDVLRNEARALQLDATKDAMARASMPMAPGGMPAPPGNGGAAPAPAAPITMPAGAV